MSIAIKITNATDIKIINCHLSGFETGIDILNSNDIFVDNTSFYDMNTCLKARNVTNLRASNNIDNSKHDFHISLSWYASVLLLIPYRYKEK